MSNSNNYTWGETARIKASAPSSFRPGKIVSICGIIEVNSAKLAKKYESEIGEWVYTVEYIGGEDREIPERFLEKMGR